MQGNELNNMLEENSFVEWGNNEVACFSSLSDEERSDLMECYIMKQSANIVKEDTFKKALAPNKLSFADAIKKSCENSMKCAVNLSNKVDELNKKYGTTNKK